jgi:hypothetical protein
MNTYVSPQHVQRILNIAAMLPHDIITGGILYVSIIIVIINSIGLLIDIVTGWSVAWFAD